MGYFLRTIFILVLLANCQIDAQTVEDLRSARAAKMNINNISMWIREDGWSGRNPFTQEGGILFPRGSVVSGFQDGIIWGGRVDDGRLTPFRLEDHLGRPISGDSNIRVGGTNWTSALQAGRILDRGVAEDSLNADVRIWRIRRDWQTADLGPDAADVFGVPADSVTQEQIDAVFIQYERDWQEWPWQKGAPFYDVNGNQVMDENEEPGLAFADQVIWLTVNDLDSAKVTNFYGSRSIGLEVQITLWAYKSRDFDGRTILSDAIFKRYRFIYKGAAWTPGAATIDSMYVGIWLDTDLGLAGDDFLATDTTLDLSYAYNSSYSDPEFLKYGLAPTAVGYTLLQGPLVPADAASAGHYGFRLRPGFRNLALSSNWLEVTGDSHSDPSAGRDFRGTLQFWNLLRGYQARPEIPAFPWRRYNPQTGELEEFRFRFTGDPVRGTGWLDESPGDRRFMITTGPFQMAPGDTQEVVVGLVGGSGSSRLSSISVLKHNVGLAKMVSEGNFEVGFVQEIDSTPAEGVPEDFRLSQNFPNPFNAETRIAFDLPVASEVRLEIFNILGERVRTLVDAEVAAGAHSVVWDGRNESSRQVVSGIYFYQIEIGPLQGTRRMLLLR